jgi:hypothetical protein
VTLSPLQNETNHKPNEPIYIFFNQPLRPETLPESNSWTLTDSFGRPIELDVRFDAGFSKITIRPNIPLRSNTDFQITTAPNIMTAAGESIAESIGEWRFRTAPSAALNDNLSTYANDNDGVLRLDLTVTEGETPFTLEDLLADRFKDDDFDPYIRVHAEGERFASLIPSSNATVKLRGATSRLATQKSFRIRIDPEENDWHGHRQINLLKSRFETARIRNRLSYELFEIIPNITSLRTQFVQLFINGEDYGLFTQVEHYDEHFLENHGLDAKGHLYKAAFFEWFRYPDDLKLESDPTYDKDRFESRLEIKADDKHEKLLRLLDDINDQSLNFSILFDQYFNRENYLTWLAFNLLTGNIDTNSQNFTLYSPTDSQTWYLLPWDYDGAWGFNRQPTRLTRISARWQEGLANYWNVALHKRFMRIDSNRIALEKKMDELRTQQLNEENVASVLDRYQDLVQTFISRPPDLTRLPTEDRSSDEAKIAEWLREYRRLPTEIAFNNSLYTDTLNRPMPIFLGNPQQNTDSIRFTWSESEQLLGHSFTYDFELSSSPAFEEGTILESRSGLSQLDIELSPLPPAGNYFFRVFIRSNEAPETNWQLPFDTYFDDANALRFRGLKAFTVN